MSTKRTPEIVAEILERMSGGEPLAVILRSRPEMPHQTRWNAWCREDAELGLLHDEARDAGADVIAADCLAIADDGSNDWMKSNDPKNPGWVLNKEHIQRSRLRIEARLKLLAKWAPKKYGDRLELVGDDKNPLVVKRAAADYTDDELAAIIAAKPKK